jgi:hypothetical protein
MCDRWREPLDQYADEARTPKPEHVAQWIDDYVMRQRKRYCNPAVRRILQEIHTAADAGNDPTGPLPDERYRKVLDLVIKLPVPRIFKKVEDYTYFHSTPPGEKRRAAQNFAVSVLGAVVAVLGLLFTAAVTVGVVASVVPNPDDEVATLLTQSATATVAPTPGHFHVHLIGRHTGREMSGVAICRAAWHAVPAFGGQSAESRGVVGAPAELRSGTTRPFEGTIDLSQVLAAGADVRLDLWMTCSSGRGTNAQSDPAHLLVQHDSNRVVGIAP